MDILSLIGLVVAFGSILGGQVLEGGHIGSIMNAVALLIVLGGTTGAVMLQTPLPVFMNALKITSWVFLPPKLEAHAAIEKIVGWSNIARKEGLLGLESVTETEPDLFARKGLQLLVDGSEPDVIRTILEVEIDAREHHDVQSAKVYEGMGGYCPTVGIIGAVMGLIHVMGNLADPSALGSGIAVAFVATIYGVGLANLFFLPFAVKLKSLIHNQTQFRTMILEGIISIAQGENPRNIETKLQGYVH